MRVVQVIVNAISLVMQWDLMIYCTQTGGSPLRFSFDSGSSHDFVNVRSVRIWGLMTTIANHTYKVHLAMGGYVYSDLVYRGG